MQPPDDPTAAPDRAPRTRRRTAAIITGGASLAALGAVLHLTGVLPPG